MTHEVELYCMMAINRDLLTADEFAILSEINTEDNTPEEFVELLDICDLMGSREVRHELLDKIGYISEHEKEAERASARGRPEPEATTRTAADGVPLDLDWFCHWVVEEGLLAADICLCLFANLEDAGDLLGFAQSLMDTGMIADLDKVQKLVEKSAEMKNLGDPPPSSVLNP